VSGSVSFDRAAAYYDRTRRITPEASAELTHLLAGELEGRRRALEIGLGTGLVGLPLHAAGVPLAGVDISPAMLGELRRKAGGTWPFPIAVADATRLPFADRTFGGAIARHVLHLIPDWRAAAAELVRVVAPGGVVLIGYGASSGPWQEVDDHLGGSLGPRSRRPGMQPGDLGALDLAFAELGGTPRELAPVWQASTYTVDIFLGEVGERVHSWTWTLDEDVLRAAIDDTRTWALERYGATDLVLEPRFPIPFRAYDLH
jgi:SAM-dependent methyltransferase